MVDALRINTGVKISGGAHAVLILWMMVGGLFSFDRNDLEFTEVTVISGEQFAAMMAARPNAPDVADALPSPSAPEVAEAPDVPETLSAPEAMQAPEVAETPEAEAAPEFDDTFETPQAEVQPVAPPAPVAPDTPDGASMVLAPENAPAPRQAPRVAPQPAERPAPDAEEAPEIREAVRPDATQPAETQVEAETATAPQEATTQIVTEATDEPGGTAIALAPTGTPRPRTRPARPVTAPVTQAASSDNVVRPDDPPAPNEPAEPAEPEEPAFDDAIAAALAEAVAAGTPSQLSGSGTAPSGPPLSSGERDALRLGIERCWSVGSLSTDALSTTVTVYVRMNENATPDIASIDLIGFQGGNEAAARQAFEAARRAIIRCGSSGYDLPPEKYAHWREIEMVFNPENMRIK